jgi:uncharacterized Rmd1/YagE family protein
VRVPLRAWLLQSEVDLKRVKSFYPDHYPFGGDAVLIRTNAENGHRACVTSFGGIVFWPFDEPSARETAERVRQAAGNAAVQEEVEDRLVVEVGKSETKVLFNEIWLADDPSPDHVSVIALLLAQSVALESMELQVDDALDRFEAQVRDVRERGRVRLSSRKVLQRIGFAMQTRHAVLNNLALMDKPDITWEREEIEKLHERLHDHFDLEERLRTINRKLDFLADNTSLLMEVLQAQKSLRLEWAIVILIALEILIFGYWELVR